MPSTDDASDGEPTTDGDSDLPPTPLSTLLVRPALEAWVGVLLASTGFHGWWYVLTSEHLYGYSLPAQMWDLALLFAGVFLLFVAVGRAASRVQST